MILTLFLHTIVNISWFFGFFSNVGACWWYLVVTQYILVMVIGGFSSTCKFYTKILLILSLKSALMYFQATEYVLWSLSYSVWMYLEFLLIYKQVGPSRTEIIAKRSFFQRKIWTNQEKISEPKSQKNHLKVCKCVYIEDFFVLIKNT